MNLSFWFSFILPSLLVLWCLAVFAFVLKRSREGRGGVHTADSGSQSNVGSGQESRMASPAKWNTIIALGLIALVFTLIPFRGLPFGRWLAGANVHASIPLLVLLAEAIWKSFGQRGWLRDRDRAMTWLFGGVAGCILYPLALGLGSFDPYIWGWQFSLLFVGTSVLTLLFLWKQNRFGLLLFLSIVAYDLRCLESTNLWDYLVDPIYWLLSLAMLAKGIWKEVRRKKIPSLPQPTCSAMNAR